MVSPELIVISSFTLKDLSGSPQYAFGSLCACGDLLTCTAAHTHKSDKSPPSVAAAAAAAAAASAASAVAVATRAVAAVVVVTMAVAPVAAVAVGMAAMTIWHIVHRVEAMHICSRIAVDNDPERDGVDNLSSVDVA